MNHSLDNSPSGEQNEAPGEAQQPVALRGVPWLWRGLLVGLAPIFSIRLAGAWLGGSELPPGVPWLFLIFTLLGMVWVFRYPGLVAPGKDGRWAPRFSTG